jgi:hypothetical protein
MAAAVAALAVAATALMGRPELPAAAPAQASGGYPPVTP